MHFHKLPTADLHVNQFALFLLLGLMLLSSCTKGERMGQDTISNITYQEKPGEIYWNVGKRDIALELFNNAYHSYHCLNIETETDLYTFKYTILQTSNKQICHQLSFLY